ncbi:hypothetical protein ABZ897_38150 [Nonomuraea sp. NPDC046802]|uniref:hypothetical protein n=1 Tax=Nonomuraea sp. NPDC046802 TaxID=3154919 RepID=UPI0033D28AEB
MIRNRAELASNIAEIVGVTLVLLTFILDRRPKPLPLPVLCEHLRSEANAVLHRDAQVHGLLGPKLLPMRLCDGSGKHLWRENDAAVWSGEDFQERAAGLVTGPGPTGARS